MEEQKKRTDWLGLIAILFLVIGGSMFTYHYSTTRISQCGREPILYGVKELVSNEDKQDIYNFSFIRVSIYKDINSIFPLKSYEFNYGVPRKNNYSGNVGLSMQEINETANNIFNK